MPSTSLLESVPLNVGVPCVALDGPPASVTAPVMGPLITAASLTGETLIAEAMFKWVVLLSEPVSTTWVKVNVRVPAVGLLTSVF